MTRKRIEELLSRAGPRIRTRFRQVMARVRDRWTVARLESALAAGTIAEVLDDVEAAAKALADKTAEVDNAVAIETAAYLADKLGTMVSYDTSNDRAVRALRADRLRLVSGLMDDHRAILVDVISDGIARGTNPREQARGIRDSLGLTSQQAKWVRSYSTALRTLDAKALDMALRDGRRDPTVERAIEQGKPLSDEQIDSMTARYADRAIAYRAEVVARTESLRAVHQGSHLAFEHAIDEGTLDAERIVQRWHAGDPPRTRAWHASMDGVEVAWGQAFTSGLGNALRFPGDPLAPAKETAQCRCAVSRRILPAPTLVQVTASIVRVTTASAAALATG